MAIETTFTDIALSDVLNVATKMKNEGQRAAQILCVNTDEGTDITYSYIKDGIVSNYRVCGVTSEDTVPSIQRLFLGIFPFENEAVDLFNVKVEGMILDFAGNFYQLAEKAPMTIISPAQKAAREKAKKQAEAKAAKAAAAAQAAQGAPEAAAASNWKGKSADRIEAMIAAKGLDADTANRVREGVAKYAERFNSAGGAQESAPEPEVKPEAAEETASYFAPILPAAVALPSTAMVLDDFIGRMAPEKAEVVRNAIKAKEERDGFSLGSQFDVATPDLSAEPVKVTVPVSSEAKQAPQVPVAVPVASTKDVIDDFLSRMSDDQAASVQAAIQAKEQRDGKVFGNDGFPPAEAEQEQDGSQQQGEWWPAQPFGAKTGKDGE